MMLSQTVRREQKADHSSKISRRVMKAPRLYILTSMNTWIRPGVGITRGANDCRAVADGPLELVATPAVAAGAVLLELLFAMFYMIVGSISYDI